MKKAAKKADVRAKEEEAVRRVYELGRKPSNAYKHDRKMMIESTDFVGRRCMLGNDGTIYLNETDRAKLWKAQLPKIINEENEWDQLADTGTTEGPNEMVI